jgi:hypothetical protein
MSGLLPKPITTATGKVTTGIADIASVEAQQAKYKASFANQKALEAESEKLIKANTSTDNEEKLSLQMPKGGKPRKSRRHLRRSRKNKRSRRRRQRHH